MMYCKSVYINGDYQNGFSLGVKTNNFIPTKIEEKALEYEASIDREYLVWEENTLVASISNIPVLVFYVKDTK